MDCNLWIEFLLDNNSACCRPMVDLSRVDSSVEIGFSSDASAAEHLGFAAVFGTRWIQAFWNPDFIEQNEPSIKYLELYALTAGILTWKEDSKLQNT